MKHKKHLHGFQVPQDYFDNLEERVMQKIALDNLPKDTGMTVPEGYFEQLEARIVANAIKPEAKKVPKLIKLNTLWKVAAAASVIGIGLWLFPAKSGVDLNTNTMVNTEITIDYYIEDMLSDMPDEGLYNLIEDAELDASSFSNNINKQELEEYLMENLDLSTLLSYE